MILDRQNGWLFVKTGKVGGTSVEIALSRICSKSSVITPNMPHEEELRKSLGYREAQRYQLPLRRYTAAQVLRRLIKGKRPADLYWDHMSAEVINELIGKEIYSSLYKFSILRNPFDETVSRWRWYGKRFGREKVGSFEAFVFNNPQELVKNKQRISIDGVRAVDYVVRFEHMHEDFENISNALKLDQKFFDDLRELKLKSGSSGGKVVSPAELYEEAPGAEELVRMLNKDILEEFGYYKPSERTLTNGSCGS